VLTRNGYRVVDAPGQRCCGALHAHAGEAVRARSLARANIGAFERSRADQIVANAAGCGAMMKEYANLLRDDPEWADRAARFSARVRDVSELLAAAGPASPGGLTVHATWDAPCHLVHAQRIAEPPLTVLRSIPGLKLTPLSDSERCCGGAGIYTLVQPDSATAILRDKVERIRDSGADVVVTGNPGCHMQIGAGLLRAGLPVRCAHPVDLLDSAYGRTPTA
jgi:glycolate oxidase iron-sulfur subunit